MTNRLLTLKTAVSVGEKVETAQTSGRGRVRVVVVEKTAASRAWTSKRVVSSLTPREVEKASRPSLSALERKRQQREAAKIERTRKAIEKRLKQKRAKAAQPPSTQPHSRAGNAKHRARLIAAEEARKDKVARLAQSLLSAAMASLPDRVKATQEVAWLDQLHVVNWGVRDRRRMEFVRRVLASIIAGKMPLTIEKPDGGFFRWPSTEVDFGPATRHIETPMEELGVLRSVGYRVGKRGLSFDERRTILAAVYERELDLPLPTAYLSDWGRPQTARRLQKLANTIAALTRARKLQSKDSSAAIGDWEYDLGFLRRTYYVGKYDFPWPRH